MQLRVVILCPFWPNVTALACFEGCLTVSVIELT